MQKTAKECQEKSSARYPRICEITKKSADISHITLAFRVEGQGKNFVLALSRREVAAKISEIESALALGSEIFNTLAGYTYEISTKLLRKLSDILSSYIAVSGGSGAQVARKGVSTPTKSKAPARAAAVPLPSKGQAPCGDCRCNAPIPDVKKHTVPAARKNLTAPKDTCANSDLELDNTTHTARLSADFENQLARILGEELRNAVMPLLAEIDAIAALLKECASELSASKSDGKCNAISPSSSEIPFSTRRGRTSIVVGRRKVY